MKEKEALKLFQRSAENGIFESQLNLGLMYYQRAKGLGLQIVAPDSPADSSTGIFLPEGMDGGKLFKFIRDDMGVTLAGGQDQWKGKIVRIAHLGYIDSFDIIIAISALEMALKKMGHNVALGKGVAAAQEILLEGY